MDTVSEYKNSPDPLLRATYWLIRYAWGYPKRFETLYELSKEVEAVSKQNRDLVAALEDALKFIHPLSSFMGKEGATEKKIKQALAQVGE